MQKKCKKASILIWAIFLSLIISISFLSISSKLSKKLKNNSIYNINLEKNSKIENILNSSNSNNENFDNIQINIENSTMHKTLKKYEYYEIKFLDNSNITLKLTSSGVLQYNTGTTNSGFLGNNNPILTTNINSGTKLKLKNFSGYLQFKLTSDKKFENSGKKYKITEKVGNKTLIRNSGIIE